MEIQDYPNYLIYDDGRVWSKVGKGKFLKNGRRTEYSNVTICANGKTKTYAIHRLVAIYYIPNPENKRTVDHIDRNPLNNHVSNLRWATDLEQSANKKILFKTNRSGHANITDIQSNEGRQIYWRYAKRRKGHKTIHRQFISKIDCICYKYIALLKIKAGVI